MTFTEWLSQWADEIEQSQRFTQSDLPTSAEDIQPNLSRTGREYPRMAELLAECEKHLTVSRAAETLQVRKDPDYEDLTAPERKVIVESNLAEIVRVRDILKATCRALEERSYALLNQRNYAKTELRMTAHAE